MDLTFNAAKGHHLEVDELLVGGVSIPDGGGGEGGGGAPAAHHASHETGGSDAITTLDASVIKTGTLLDAVIPATIPRLANLNKIFLVAGPYDNEPPVSAFATLDARNGHPCLDFDGNTPEEAVFTGQLPPTYGGGGITVDTWWSFTSDVGGKSLIVQAAIERIDLSGLDLDADSFASFQSATGTTPATVGAVIKVSIPFTAGAQMDGAVAGELIRIKIRRDAGADVASADAELLRLIARET